MAPKLWHLYLALTMDIDNKAEQGFHPETKRKETCWSLGRSGEQGDDRFSCCLSLPVSSAW